MDTQILLKVANAAGSAETRTTCTLTKEGAMALERLCEEYHLKQKKVFDLLVDEKYFLENISTLSCSNGELPLAREVRKSLVITKKNLKVINDVSDKSGISRDILLDKGFRYLIGLIDLAKKNEKETYEKVKNILDEFSGKASVIDKSFDEYLGEDDPIRSRFSPVISILDNLVSDINRYLENGTPIEAL
jgi:hypothetical protein